MSQTTKRTGADLSERFVGRGAALRAFYTRFAYRHMQNAVYYCGDGGTGKTWLLRRIWNDNQGDSARRVPEVVDFFNTDNHSIRGLQANIQRCLAVPAEFEAYDQALAELERMRLDPQTEQTGALASQEQRVNYLFIEACKCAAQGKDQVLLFDTFERVQERDVGRWFLSEFVPQVRNAIIAFAGRPEPEAAQVSGNVLVYPMAGLTYEEILASARDDYDEEQLSDDVILKLWEASNHGVPLRLNLLFKRAPHHLLQNQEKLTDMEAVDREIASDYRLPTPLNRLLWAMTYLKRRFDVDMLRYVVENSELLSPQSGDYQAVRTKLLKLEFIKEYPDLQSHLLHDEVQRIFQIYLLPDVDQNGVTIRGPLYNLIVERYYNEQIMKAETAGETTLERELRAEQLGYILDRNAATGLAYYRAYREQVRRSRDYDLEELLWGEVQEHLAELPDQGYPTCLERAEWLQRQGRFDLAEKQYRYVLKCFRGDPEKTLQPSLGLGHVLLREGQINLAIKTFVHSRDLIQPQDSYSLAKVSNHLGQALRVAGRWDEALDQYGAALAAFAAAGDKLWAAGVYSNRSYIYALKGEYDRAKRQCHEALNLLEKLSESDPEVTRFKIYALLNQGTAFRHSGDYDSAAYYYQQSLDKAEETHDLEAMCNCYQHLGSNACLAGRRQRLEHRSIAEACRCQKKALYHISQALMIARPARWRLALGEALSRLARVFEEIGRLDHMFAKIGHSAEERDLRAFRTLIESAYEISLPEETEFQHRLESPGPFRQVNWLGRSARLFEMSALMANLAFDFHRSLDSQMQLARLLLEQGYPEETRRVVWYMGKMTGAAYQQDLFLMMADITLADLHFEQGEYETALQEYGQAYPKAAKQTGYASYLLTDRLRHLEERFRHFLPDQAEQVMTWCEQLAQAWHAGSVSTTRPDMLDLLEAIRLDAETCQ